MVDFHICLVVSGFQAMTCSLFEIATRIFPSGENKRLVTTLLYLARVKMFFPVNVSHNLTVASVDAEASKFRPSFEKAIRLTMSVWPSKICTCLPLWVLHSLTVRSKDEDASVWLSGEKEAPRTQSP